MELCPGCNEPFVRFFKVWESRTDHFVHKKHDCLVPMDGPIKHAAPELEIARLKGLLAVEQRMRRRREEQLKAIMNYSSSQIYIEEISYEEVPNGVLVHGGIADSAGSNRAGGSSKRAEAVSPANAKAIGKRRGAG